MLEDELGTLHSDQGCRGLPVSQLDRGGTEVSRERHRDVSSELFIARRLPARLAERDVELVEIHRNGSVYLYTEVFH